MARANVRRRATGSPGRRLTMGTLPTPVPACPALFSRFFTVWTRSGPSGYIFAVNTGKRRSLEAANDPCDDRLRARGGFARWHQFKIE